MRSLEPTCAIPYPDPTFVGRVAELSRIDGHLATTPLYVVYGAPGAGKTELVCAALDRARARRPWKTLRISGSGGALVDQLAATLDGARDLSQVVEALEREPTWLLIDDAQLFDAKAIAALAGATQERVRSSRVFIASRCVLPLGDLLASAVAVHLGPLSPADSRRLASRLAERSALHAADTDKVFEPTGGNPAAIRRYVVGLRTTPMSEAVSALPSTARATLGLLSLLGGSTTIAAIAEALQCPELQASSAADLLAEQFLASRDRDDELRALPSAGAAFIAHAPAKDRGEAAARAVLVVERALARDPAKAARNALDAMPGVVRAGHAGRAAELIALIREPALHAGLDQPLLAAVQATVAGLAEPEDRLLALHARLLLRLGRAAEARVAARRLSDSAAAELEVLVAARMGHVVEASRLAQDAAPDLGQPLEKVASTDPMDAAEPPTAAALAGCLEDSPHADLGLGPATVRVIRALDLDRLEQARTCAARALQDSAGSIVANLLHGAIATASGDPARAIPRLENANRAAADQRDVLLEVLSAAYLGSALCARGEPELAVDVLVRGSARAHASGLPWLAQRCAVALTTALAAQGAPERAIARAVDFDELVDTGRQGTEAACALARCHAMLGDLDRARSLLHAADDAPRPQRAVLDLARLEIEAWGGSPAAGIEAGRRARRHFASAERHYAEACASVWLSACYLADGGEWGVASAQRELRRARELATQYDYRHLLLLAASFEAAAAAAQGNPVRANKILTGTLRAAKHTVGGQQPAGLLLRSALDPELALRAPWPGLAKLVRAIGLAGQRELQLADGDRSRAVLADRLDDELAPYELVVDTRSSGLRAGDQDAVHSRPIVCALLARLVDAGAAGVDAETLYIDVWGAAEYHPLRHRNTLQVTLSHARRAIAPLFDDQTIVEKVAGGWRISPAIRACAIREIARA